MNSGNTYRFRLDGSRIEQFTHGQVNPFGLCFDRARQPLFPPIATARRSINSSRGGYYPSFGKPHDGLGFAPRHDGPPPRLAPPSAASSTTATTSSPPSFATTLFIGNVMTSRINRDKLDIQRLARPKRIEQPDFLTRDDPWFRPVDIQLGPDGALYIADFYNRIIGHYEVPLPHPGRDRERGRIWRVIYRGSDGQPKLHQRTLDLTKASTNELIARTRRSESYLADACDEPAL